MLFFLLSMLILGLQILHRRFLREILPDRWSPWIAGVLIALHVPLALFMALRLTGFATHPLSMELRFLSRAALYFQVITVANLLVWAAASALWAFRRWVRELRDNFLQRPSGDRITSSQDFGRQIRGVHDVVDVTII